MARVARFIYSGLRVRNLPRSIRFYERTGFKVVSRGTMKHGGKWVHLRYPGAVHELELNYYPPGNRFFEPIRRGTEFDHLGFYAADIEAWRRAMLRAGAPLASEFDDGNSRILYFRDPDGNWIEAFGPIPRVAPPKRKR